MLCQEQGNFFKKSHFLSHEELTVDLQGFWRRHFLPCLISEVMWINLWISSVCMRLVGLIQRKLIPSAVGHWLFTHAVFLAHRGPSWVVTLGFWMCACILHLLCLSTWMYGLEAWPEALATFKNWGWVSQLGLIKLTLGNLRKGSIKDSLRDWHWVQISPWSLCPNRYKEIASLLVFIATVYWALLKYAMHFTSHQLLHSNHSMKKNHILLFYR